MTTDRIDTPITADEDDVRGYFVIITRPGGCNPIEQRILDALSQGLPIFPLPGLIRADNLGLRR